MVVCFREAVPKQSHEDVLETFLVLKRDIKTWNEWQTKSFILHAACLTVPRVARCVFDIDQQQPHRAGALMRKIGHKIAKPFFLHFLHKPDFAGFSQGFHWLFMAFSRFFHGVTIFANLVEVAPSIFQALDIFGGGTLLG